MKVSRRVVRGSLEEMGRAPVPLAPPGYFENGERRLLELDVVLELDTPAPVRRRIFTATPRRVIALGFAAAISAASIAVALVVDHGKPNAVQAPAGEATTPATTARTTIPATAAEQPTTPAATDATTTLTTAPKAPTTAPNPLPTVVPAPKTEPATTATTRDETTTPATLTLACVPSGPAAVRCEWSASSVSGLAGYRILRSTPGTTSGRAFETGPADHAFTDATAAAGISYIYVVQAINAAGTVLEHTPMTSVSCC